MKNTGIFVTGVLLAAVAAFLVHQRLNQDGESDLPAGKSYARIKPELSISKGEAITWSQLERVGVPARFQTIGKVAVRFNDDTRVLLQSNEVRANRDLAGGSILLHEYLGDEPAKRFATSIGLKNRAVTIPVSEISAVAYFVEPGSNVDILVTVPKYDSEALAPLSSIGFGDRASSSELTPESVAAAYRPSPVGLVTKTLLQNMRVLAVGRATSRGAYLKSAGGYRSITLDATPEEAELLTFAMTQTQGGLNIVLRNPINDEEQDIAEIDWEDLK